MQEEAKVFECGVGDGRDTDADRFRRGENDTKIEVDNVELMVARKDRMETIEWKRALTGKGGCIGHHIMPRLDLVYP